MNALDPYYAVDGVTIFHGDYRDILPTLPAVDLAFADPPYAVEMKYENHDDFRTDSYPAEMQWLAQELRRLAPIVLVTPGIRNLTLWPNPTWILAWHKPGSTRRSDLGGFNTWEPVLMYGKRLIYNDAVRLPDCVNHAGDTARDHPCPKPLRLMSWLVEIGSAPGATVLDPVMGSGTTLRAAKDAGRRAIGIEKSERYCEIAAKRLAQGVLELW